MVKEEKELQDKEVKEEAETEVSEEQLEAVEEPKAEEAPEEKPEAVEEAEEKKEELAEEKKAKKPKKEKAAEEEEIVEEKFYTVPLGKAWITPPRRRVPRAMRMLKSFITKHMKLESRKETEEEEEEVNEEEEEDEEEEEEEQCLEQNCGFYCCVCGGSHCHEYCYLKDNYFIKQIEMYSNGLLPTKFYYENVKAK